MKKQFLCTLSGALCVLFLSSACKQNITTGKGEKGDDYRKTGSFTEIQIEAPIHAIVNVGATTPSVKLSGYKNLLSLIKMEVKGQTLRIYLDELAHIRADEDIVADISIPSLAGLSISGKSDAEIKGIVSGNSLALDITGAGAVVADEINTNTLTAEMSGAGSLKVNKGKVNKAVYEVTGAGEINCFNLVTRETEVEVTGAGDVEVNVTDKLTADVTGAGDVTYKGRPQLVANRTGAGSIAQAD